MALRDLDLHERAVAIDVIGWALTPEAAELDLDLALEVREKVGKGGHEADWDGAWTATAQLVVLAWEKRGWVTQRPELRPIEEEGLVVELARLLQARPAR